MKNCGRAHFSILLIITVIVSMLLNFEVTLKPVIGSTTTKLYPIADADVNSANPDANHGSSIRLNISFNSKLSYAYVMFNLSSIPSEARITSAKFELYLMSARGEGPLGMLWVGTHYCPDNSWTELGITWNNKPDFEPEATAERIFGKPGAIVWLKRYYSWEITADVAMALWYGKLTEVLKFYPSGDWGDFKFHSKDTSTGDRSVASPFLEVEYTIPFSSTISCSVEPAIIESRQPANVSGGISPPHSGVEVTLTYTRPEGSLITRDVTATATGNYSDLYTPDRVGPWSVHASWAGDEDHAEAKSPKALFTVTTASSLISRTLWIILGLALVVVALVVIALVAVITLLKKGKAD